MGTLWLKNPEPSEEYYISEQLALIELSWKTSLSNNSCCLCCKELSWNEDVSAGAKHNPVEEQISSAFFSPFLFQTLNWSALQIVNHPDSSLPSPECILPVTLLKKSTQFSFVFFPFKRKKPPSSHTVQLNLTDVCSFTTKSWLQDGVTCLVLEQKQLYYLDAKPCPVLGRGNIRNNNRWDLTEKT